MEDLKLDVNRAGRLVIIISHKMNRKNKTATKEISDPTEETAFHVVYASG
jgi:hypothetical protein